MKIIICVFFLIPFIARSQAVQIESFIGIKFGATKNDALLTAQSRGALLSSMDQQEELVFLSGLKFAGIESKQAYLKFVNNQFFEGTVEFEVDSSDFVQLFNTIKLQLINSYGYGKDYSWFDSPYYWGDGNEFLAILNRKGKLCHAWGNTKQITSADFIVMEVCADRVLRVVFQSHNFASMAARRSLQISSAN